MQAVRPALRVVEQDASGIGADDVRYYESEATVLARVYVALEEAIDHPNLSANWRYAFASARDGILDCLPATGRLSAAGPQPE